MKVYYKNILRVINTLIYKAEEGTTIKETIQSVNENDKDIAVDAKYITDWLTENFFYSMKNLKVVNITDSSIAFSVTKGPKTTELVTCDCGALLQFNLSDHSHYCMYCHKNLDPEKIEEVYKINKKIEEFWNKYQEAI